MEVELTVNLLLVVYEKSGIVEKAWSFDWNQVDMKEYVEREGNTALISKYS